MNILVQCIATNASTGWRCENRKHIGYLNGETPELFLCPAHLHHERGTLYRGQLSATYLGPSIRDVFVVIAGTTHVIVNVNEFNTLTTRYHPLLKTMLWEAMQDYCNRFTTIPPGDLPQHYTTFTPDRVSFMETQRELIRGVLTPARVMMMPIYHAQGQNRVGMPADSIYVMIELAYTSKEEYACNFEQYYPNAKRTTRTGDSEMNLPALIERIIHCIPTENQHDFLFDRNFISHKVFAFPWIPDCKIPETEDILACRVTEAINPWIRLFNSKALLVDEMKTHLRLQDANCKRYLDSQRPQNLGDSA
ncbi:hypothetical protein BG006_000392 [Podila minutissima]|uniref:Uncharacterized protein n=1 Tax=Podila minutissima TaxID=64525 RepID=A0A9P5VHQ3_9FUNG|nr:hypothetical protein BG006_000392 [Podila minutissima]